MNELSKFLKVDDNGRLVTLDIKREDGTMVVPGKVNEGAIVFLQVLDSVNSTFNTLWKDSNIPATERSPSKSE